MTDAKTRRDEKAKRNDGGDCVCFIHLIMEDVWFELPSVTVNNTSNLAGSRQRLQRLGCGIAIRRPSDSNEISIDNIGRDRMKEGRGEDILPKAKWMVRMDGDKR